MLPAHEQFKLEPIAAGEAENREAAHASACWRCACLGAGALAFLPVLRKAVPPRLPASTTRHVR
jgi:hypothetical protein